MLFDSHSHIHDVEFDADRDECLARMREMNVATIAVGCDVVSSQKAIALAEKESNVWTTIGLHPTTEGEDFNPADYADLVKSQKVVGVGECGLDYFRLTPEQFETESARQERNFRAQIDFAIAHDKALMLHVRPSKGSTDAHDRAIEILKEYLEVKPSNIGVPGRSAPMGLGQPLHLRGTSHFFTSTTEVAQKYIDLGFTISFPGVITFAPELESVVRSVPLDSILLETDSPYAAPAPHRGKKNEPPFVSFVAKKIAEIKNCSVEEVIEATTRNTCRVFSIQL